MRLRIFTVSLAVAAVAALPLAGVAAAQPGDRDCADFSSQQEAQAALLPGDPERLDEDDDGEACENHDYGSSATPTTTAPTTTPPATADADDGQVSVVPQGAVDTGDGSSDTGSAPLLIAGVVAVGLAAGAAHRRVRTSR